MRTTRLCVRRRIARRSSLVVDVGDDLVGFESGDGGLAAGFDL